MRMKIPKVVMSVIVSLDGAMMAVGLHGEAIDVWCPVYEVDEASALVSCVLKRGRVREVREVTEPERGIDQRVAKDEDGLHN